MNKTAVFRKLIPFLMLILLSLLSGCRKQTTTETVQYQTLPAVTGSIRKGITFIGNVTASQTSSLNWTTTGVIEQVNVKIGDTVTRGQILATLNADSLSTAVINAEIPLINAQEELDDVLSSETPKTQAYKELKDKESALIDAESYQESLKYPHATVGDIAYWSEQVDIYREYYEEAKASLDEIGRASCRERV